MVCQRQWKGSRGSPTTQANHNKAETSQELTYASCLGVTSNHLEQILELAPKSLNELLTRFPPQQNLSRPSPIGCFHDSSRRDQHRGQRRNLG